MIANENKSVGSAIGLAVPVLFANIYIQGAPPEFGFSEVLHVLTVKSFRLFACRSRDRETLEVVDKW